jgi:hypothetical protein
MKKIHFEYADTDQPSCKVVPDHTRIILAQEWDKVTCLGCLNFKWRRENPWPEALRIVQSYT